jgi:hypothetical protein
MRKWGREGRRKCVRICKKPNVKNKVKFKV